MNAGKVFRRLLGIAGRAVLVLIVIALGLAASAVWYFRARETKPALETGDVVMPRGTRAIELYFPNARGYELALETREVVEESVEGETLVRTVLAELLRGPDDPGSRAVFPEGVTLAHVFRDPGGGLYLDFSSELKSGFRGGSSAEMLLVSSLMRTLSANLPEVNRVTLTAAGQPITTLSGHVRLDGPLVIAEWR